MAALSPLASHAAPQVLRIDGSLFNASGAPITGSRDVQVKAYDAATGGSAVWTSSVYTADVANGRFSIALDATADTTSLTSRLAAKAASGEIWFAIDYDTGTADGDMDSAVTVAPRIRGRGSMFALVAANADTLTGVTATVAEMNRLAGVTANIQSQIDALAAGGSASAKVSKTGDSMSGALEVGAVIRSSTAYDTSAAGGQYKIAGQSMISVGTGYGAGNLILGGAGASIGDAFGNTLIGVSAAIGLTDGWRNVVIGRRAGAAGTSLADSVIIGNNAGAATTNGQFNVMLGSEAGRASTTHQGTFVGGYSGYNNTTGWENAFFGYRSGYSNTDATNNTYIGVDAGRLSTGDRNTFTGAHAGELNTTGRYNSFYGSFAGYTNDTGERNTYVGRGADGLAGISVSVGLGYHAQANASNAAQIGEGTNTVANSLQFRGINFLNDTGAATFSSLSGVTSINSSVSSTELDYLDGVTANIGSKLNKFTSTEAAYLSGASANIQTQLNALAGGGGGGTASDVDLTAVAASIKIGGNSFIGVGTGVESWNTYVGRYAGGNLNGEATGNTFVGYNAGAWTSTGDANSFFGSSTGWNNDTGYSNSFFGDSAGYGNTTGFANAYLGNGAAYGNMTGSKNSILGAGAGYFMESAEENVIVGYGAGYTVSSMGQNTLVGTYANAGSTAQNSIAIGYGAVVDAATAIQIGPGVNSTPQTLQFGDTNFTGAELGYLDGATANVQAQINAISTSASFTVRSKSASFTASDGGQSYYRISATATCTLPASPADGSVRKFKVTGGTTTFDTNGAEVINRADGTTNSSGELTLGPQDGVLELIAVSGGWDET